ncbi:uroporphyrinogen-III synthase [Sandaracinobacteroides hominis]|uniref:uroporphyrinogen-III synthase n=1 Tax=Sandaracinobacteroides hominis TaxID=2780086 RepID=UPI0018F545C5|nr:uroporphyrinogen-III synthase [Sandaracinobacteroides hominis]
MSRPALLVTRPEAEQARTLAAAQSAGFDAISAPVLHIRPLDWVVPADRPDALLLTSARAAAIAGLQIAQLRDLPVYAVGANTAAAATAAGFRVAETGDSDGSAIAAVAAADGRRRLLHLAGVAAAPIDVQPGLDVRRIAIYAADPVDRLPEPAEQSLREGRVFAALAFSVRSAQILRRLVDRADIPLGAQRLVVNSGKVAQAAGDGWGAVRIAENPGLDAVMAAARSLWQSVEHG